MNSMEISNNEGPRVPPVENKAAIKQKPEVLGHIADLEINGYPDTVAEKHAIDIRNEVLENFGKYSSHPQQELEFLMKTKRWVVNPISPYLDEANTEIIKGDMEPVAGCFWDFNGCLSLNRDGHNPEHTFHPELEEAIKMEIERLGSFGIVSALTGEQMAWHMAKEEGRALKTGEKSLAQNTIISAENGRSWLIPHQENGKTVITEYRLPLSEKQQGSLDKVKEYVGDAAQVLRGEGMVAFVNDQKFSKCTMEASKNGREWYRGTIEKVLLPYLAKKEGVVWDGNPEKFIVDGVEFAISPTGETWEIEITEGADKIGKRFAREILHNTITDIFSSRKKYGLFRIVTGGDSVKWGGSDAGLTDPNSATIPFVIQGSERPASQSMDVINEAIELKRKYWPTYVEDEKGARLAGPGVAPARFMQAVAETVPHLKIQTEEFTKFLVNRITNIYGFKEFKTYPLESDKLMLYNFPGDLTPEQRETFLKAKSDLPVQADDEVKVDELINRLNQRLA